MGIIREQNIDNSDKVWRIIYQTEGKSAVRVQNHAFHMDERSICIIPPEYGYTLAADPGSAVCYFMTDEFRPFGQRRVQLLQDDISGSVQEVITLMLRYWDKRSVNMDYAIIKSLGDACYHMLAEQYIRNEKRDYRLEKIIDLMYANLADPEFDLKKCLESSGYSVGHLRKLFLQDTGTTPTKYMNRIRIERAKSLLQQYGYSRSIKDIAFACGFRDALYFSRVFHQIEGTGPRQYRERVKGGV